MTTTMTAPGARSIPVMMAPSLKAGTQVVLGVIRMGDLVDRYEIPRRDTRHKSGYQREAATARVNRLVVDLRARRVDLPTTVLFNIREHKVLTTGPDNELRLLLDGVKLYVVDGQHRIEALRKLMDEDAQRWAEFRLSFVCMVGATEYEEMVQFYVVNSTAKSVRTDLALDLLRQQAEKDPEVMSALIERSEDWKVRAESLVEEVNRSATVWRGRVRLPGVEKGETTITNAGMVTAVKPLLATPFFGTLNLENQARIIDAYWRGIREVLPEAFEDPSVYVIQKQVGTSVMNGVLVSAIEYVRSKGWSVVEPKSYAETLRESLLQLEGDTSEGEVARGSDFWRAGPEGAAGSFSSNAGRRVLTAKIRAMLPAPDVE